MSRLGRMERSIDHTLDTESLEKLGLFVKVPEYGNRYVYTWSDIQYSNVETREAQRVALRQSLITRQRVAGTCP